MPCWEEIYLNYDINNMQQGAQTFLAFPLSSGVCLGIYTPKGTQNTGTPSVLQIFANEIHSKLGKTWDLRRSFFIREQDPFGPSQETGLRGTPQELHQG
jgi:hypothetical protein